MSNLASRVAENLYDDFIDVNFMLDIPKVARKVCTYFMYLSKRKSLSPLQD